MPSSTPPPDHFDLQGHRGARGLLPENTIPAFLLALDLGVTTLELDTVISQDGEVVVSHDPWMSETFCTTPDGQPVEEAKAHRLYAMPYAEIARYDCGQRPNPRFPEQQLRPAQKPLLREVIRAAEAHAQANGLAPVRYNVETKARPEWDDTFTPQPERFARLLYEVLEREGVAERTILQSFDVRTLQVSRREKWPMPLALLVALEQDLSYAQAVESLGFTPVIYSPDFRLVDAELARTTREAGVQLIPWTVNEADDMKRLIALGVDGLITDYPDRAQTVLNHE